MKATPHIEVTEEGKIADIVLMAGDPLRAKFAAEKCLTDVIQFNKVRNMFGYTGYYKGKKVSIMGSGMGMPSIGIYSYELFKFYGVNTIIRIGSAGAYDASCNVYDVVLAEKAYSESNYAFVQSGYQDCFTYPTANLNQKILEVAKANNINLHVGPIHSSDVFYSENPNAWKDVHDKYGCLAVEMESFALFNNARVLGKNAACLLTISDSFITHDVTTSEERRKKFMEMIILGLETALQY